VGFGRGRIQDSGGSALRVQVFGIRGIGLCVTGFHKACGRDFGYFNCVSGVPGFVF
jgi:hypothetical protein